MVFSILVQILLSRSVNVLRGKAVQKELQC